MDDHMYLQFQEYMYRCISSHLLYKLQYHYLLSILKNLHHISNQS